MPRKKEISFEEALQRLEEIVEKMENGDASLQELMANYSEGVELSQNCIKALERAEKTMDLLIKDPAGDVETSKLIIEGE
ncbi:exodeoxyribonuclease VII small subunit [Mitsuokella sp. oral taxon 131]|uniref:exodeoxyribonuclease VII small subunit n=1 Tax=Mitsuokella sp. oral taxon 131 TaxID=1321780 RepID=UPI0003AE6405|nr:exodeoxyribonuclease VII small subunit [Mitsuokella sp. oral taxon 131]ERL05177.1 exodeoxyribonuclease VII, small subunit [Mitsuokella sp. oral taxon 131 str. W9106]